MMARFTTTVFVLALTAQLGLAEEIKIVSWNLESGEAAPSFIGGQLAGFTGVDVWGLSEVQQGDAAGYAAKCAAGESGSFKHILGTTGNSDRLVIVYNESKLQLLDKGELMNLNAQTGRAPLFAKFKTVGSGETFTFMVNHLHRGNPAKRMQQAVGLEAWAKTQTVPAVLVGDYNFDVKVSTKLGNPAFVAMTDENVFRWVEPVPFRATHKGGSVLDFVFLSGAAQNWTATSKVVALSDDAVDTLQGSDHRPVMAILKTNTSAPTPQAAVAVAAKGESNESPELAVARVRNEKRNKLLAKLGQLDKDLVEMKRLIKELGDE